MKSTGLSAVYGGRAIVTGDGVIALAAYSNTTQPGAPGFVWANADGTVSGSTFLSQAGFYYNEGDAGTQGRAIGIAAASSGSMEFRLMITTTAGRGIDRTWRMDLPGALASPMVAYWGAAPGFADNLNGNAGVLPREQFFRTSGVAMLPISGQFALPDYVVADTGNNAVRRLSYGTRMQLDRRYVTTLVGNGVAGSTGDGQFGSEALLNQPSAVAVGPGPAFPVYIADRGNNRVRKLMCLTPNLCAGTSTFNKQTQACDSGPASQALDDRNPCTTDSCEIVAVRHAPVASGTSCDDGSACNGVEACDASGACTAGPPGACP